jgi:hypothetical protein
MLYLFLTDHLARAVAKDSAKFAFMADVQTDGTEILRVQRQDDRRFSTRGVTAAAFDNNAFFDQTLDLERYCGTAQMKTFGQSRAGQRASPQ